MYQEVYIFRFNMTSGGGDSLRLSPQKDKRKEGKEEEKLIRRTTWVHDLETDNCYRQVAIVISSISVVVTIVMGVTSFVLGLLSESVATFGFACGAVLDSLTSSVVIWRYWGASTAVYSWDRERQACISLGILFTLTTTVILVKSIVALIFAEKPKNDQVVWVLSLVNGIACTLLAITKYWLGTKLHSSAVKTDAFNSLIDAVMAFAVLISATVYAENQTIWYLDPIVGICCALFFLIYGIRLLIAYVPQKLPPAEEAE